MSRCPQFKKHQNSILFKLRLSQCPQKYLNLQFFKNKLSQFKKKLPIHKITSQCLQFKKYQIYHNSQLFIFKLTWWLQFKNCLILPRYTQFKKYQKLSKQIIPMSLIQKISELAKQTISTFYAKLSQFWVIKYQLMSLTLS